MAPLLYLRYRPIQQLALVLAYQRVMGSKPGPRPRPAKQKRLPLFDATPKKSFRVQETPNAL